MPSKTVIHIAIPKADAWLLDVLRRRARNSELIGLTGNLSEEVRCVLREALLPDALARIEQCREGADDEELAQLGRIEERIRTRATHHTECRRRIEELLGETIEECAARAERRLLERTSQHPSLPTTAESLRRLREQRQPT